MLTGENVACCKCTQCPSRQRLCSQHSPSNPPNKTSGPDLSIIPQYPPREWETTRCKDVALARIPFPWLFLFFYRRMDSLKGINMLLKPSCLALSTSAFWQGLVLSTLCVYCAMLSLHFPWKSWSLNLWGEVLLVRLSYMVTTQLRNASIWDSSGMTLLKDLQGVLY